MRRILDSMTSAPAYVRNARMDILAANRLGTALFAPVLTSPAQPANNARFLFLDPAAPAFYPELGTPGPGRGGHAAHRGRP